MFVPETSLLTVRKAARLAVCVAEMTMTANHHTPCTNLPDRHLGVTSAPCSHIVKPLVHLNIIG